MDRVEYVWDDDSRLEKFLGFLEIGENSFS